VEGTTAIPAGVRVAGHRHRAGDNIVDSPHRLHAWLVPLIVDKGAESNSGLPPPFALILTGYRYGERICDVTDMRASWL
jgi:hypothetical protein